MLFPEYAREGYSIVWGRQHKMNEPLMLITYSPWDGPEIMTYSIEEIKSEQDLIDTKLQI